MTFDTLERSNYDGIPTRLYEFALGTHAWRYASGERDVVLGGVTYVATPISDSGIILSGDVENDDFTITLPANVEFAALYYGTPPSQTVNVTVRQIHRGSDEAPIVWVGILRTTKRVSPIKLEIGCRTLSASLNRNGLRLAWGKQCPHALYDRNCKVNPASYGVAVQIQSLTGATIVSTGFNSLPSGYLAGGYLEWPLLPGVMERRSIEAQSGSVVTVFGTTDGLTVGQYATFYPGCDRVVSTCNSKFNNLSNYGGFPHMPSKSPFDGDPVF